MLSSFALKIIACICMLVDHITYLFAPSAMKLVEYRDAYFYIPENMLYLAGRGIGRLAFPIFCFLLVEGFLHTHDVKKYLIRMGIFSIISEPAFDFCFGYFKDGTWLGRQNVMFTLIIGLAVLLLLDYLRKNYMLKPAVYNTASVIAIISGCLLTYAVRSDYSISGVAVILIFYYFRGRRLPITLGLIVVTLLFGQTSVMYAGTQVTLMEPLYYFEVLALIPLFMYNGKRGRAMKYAFYAFYPLHMAALGILAALI